MISAILLAAGKSTRMGLCKQLMEIEGQTMIEHVLKTLQESKVDEIIVVLGFRADEIAKKIFTAKTKIVINPNYETGQSTSLKVGLKAVNKDADAIIFVLSDQPLVKASVIDKIISEYKKNRALIVVPTYKRRRGNPVLFDKFLVSEIMDISGDIGARSLLRTHEKDVREVEVYDPGILFDIDTMKNYEDLKEGRCRRVKFSK